MPTYGPNPGTVATTSAPGFNSWSNPNYILLNDSNYAISTSDETHDTQTIYVSGFNFSIPATETVTRIVGTLRGFNLFGGIDYTYTRAKLLKNTAGSPGQTGNYVDLLAFPPGTGGVDATGTFDASQSTWGTTLSYSDVNSVNFGISYACPTPYHVPGLLYLNYTTITVYTSQPGDGSRWLLLRAG